MSRCRKAFGIFLIIAGIAVYFYPTINTWLLDQQVQVYIQEFCQTYGKHQSSAQEDNSGELDFLYQKCGAYNRQIYEDGQSAFTDAWICTQPPVFLDGVDHDEFGFIEIPSMDVKLPLYLGASDSNMAKGAAVLGETSVPIGGINTNSVIAGHRGYRGTPFFREIEKLPIGGSVYITNPWETLEYEVKDIDIISPNDSDAVKIQDGKDMVTLITCHPYRSRGEYRYVVYCERTSGGTGTSSEQDPGAGTPDFLTASDGVQYGLSEKDIQLENLARKICAVLIVGMVLLTFLRRMLYRKNKERNRI